MTRGFAAIGLYSPKDGANVGGAFRAASCYGADLIVLDKPRWIRHATNTTKAHLHIPTQVGPVLELRPFNCPMVVIEIVDGATDIREFHHPERAFYVFGPEDGSVPKDVVAAAQHVVSIPTEYCMNLAATVNVVLFDRLCKRSIVERRAAA